ncbi:MAG: DsrE family protein [Gammaproteobacteria bacterium]|jgi:predicted peroxiredoxin
MADKLMIVLVNADPADPAEVAPALYHATVAAAMEYEVEVILTGRCAGLARHGVTERLREPIGEQPLYSLIQEAHGAGVSFKLCVPAPGLNDDELIPEIEETVGGAYLISEAMDDATVTLSY